MAGNLNKDDAALMKAVSSSANVFSKLGRALTTNEDLDDEIKAAFKEMIHTTTKSILTIADTSAHDQAKLKEFFYEVVSDPSRNTVLLPESCPSQTILYKCLKSTPRGYCLIINNRKFRTLQYRGGSDIDVGSITSLFEDFLGFSVIFYENLTEKDTYLKLKNVAALKQLRTVDSLVVFLMSHGKVTDDNQLHIYSADEKLIKHDIIIRQFGNFKCPALAGCPKMFFYQVCRGSNPDFKTTVQLDNEHEDKLLSSKLSPEMACSSKDETAGPSKEAEPLITLENILRVFPSAPGYSSMRDPAKGSWMIQALIRTFRENAHNCDVETMLKMANKKIQKELGNSAISQVLCTESWGFDDKVFFNPPPQSD